MQNFKTIIRFSIVVVLLLVYNNINAQLVTNGSFENTKVGPVSSTDIKGWVIEVNASINPAPVIEIVDDTVHDGNHALKVTANAIGTNPWDIQVVADSITVESGGTYNYSVWAKCEKPGGQTVLTFRNYVLNEYCAIRPANFTANWQKYARQFRVTDSRKSVWIPIYFCVATEVGNTNYINNLPITDVNGCIKPVIVKENSVRLGSNFTALHDVSFNYVTAKVNFTELTSPGDTNRMITYQVDFSRFGILQFQRVALYL